VNLALRQPDLSERLAALRYFQNSAKRKLYGRRQKGPCLEGDTGVGVGHFGIFKNHLEFRRGTG
jgi:hypothetical protein